MLPADDIDPSAETAQQASTRTTSHQNPGSRRLDGFENLASTGFLSRSLAGHINH